MQISLWIFALQLGLYDIRADFSADLEFVLVEKKLLQVALHLHQSQVKVTFGEQMVTGFSFGSSLDGAVHCQGEGAHPSLQAGDISLDLAEKLRGRALQFIIQKS